MNAKSKVIVIDSYKNSDKKLKVGAYVRVSTNSEDQLNSYRTQLNHYQDYIQSNENWIFVDIYADEGISGRSIKKRTEFNRMLDDCCKNKLDRILVKSISRFARNTKESLEVTRELKSLGVTIFFEKENIDTAKATDEFLFTLFSQIAQEESASHSKNMKRSYRTRMEQGKFIAIKAPFGYCFEDKKLVIDEEKAEVVRKIYNDYLNGVSIFDIAEELTNSPYKTTEGYDKWTYSTIRYLLKNEKYRGDVLTQKTFVTEAIPPKQVYNKGEKDKFYVKNNHEPIISIEVFEKTQMLLDKNNVPMNNTGNPLNKKIYCAKCGATLKLRRVNNINYRACRNHDKSKDNCTLNRIPESEFNKAFVRMYNKLQLNKDILISSLISECTKMKYKSTENNQALIDINKEIADIMEQLNVVTDLKQQGYVDEAFYLEQTNEHKTRLAELKKEKQLLTYAAFDEIIFDSKELLKELESMPEYIELSDRQLFLALVNRIIVISETEIQFILKNGMHLTEKLERVVR